MDQQQDTLNHLNANEINKLFGEEEVTEAELNEIISSKTKNKLYEIFVKTPTSQLSETQTIKFTRGFVMNSVSPELRRIPVPNTLMDNIRQRNRTGSLSTATQRSNKKEIKKVKGRRRLQSVGNEDIKQRLIKSIWKDLDSTGGNMKQEMSQGSEVLNKNRA